eukprot:TRINITY_DN1544_c0_g5_i2.p1 TRINITY_DN1544_c0_g5~~TRINITY_DN1544_c0_g5_i2.p1  ORF type:complete len:205 (+),score=17.29 TRINITY_DN1544_c0_g5_i2:130-744(+)
MASYTLVTLLFSVLAISAIKANARPGPHFHPCKTLFISYTISSFKRPIEIPNSVNDQNPSAFLSIYSEFKQLEPTKPIRHPRFPDLLIERSEIPDRRPIRFASFDRHKPEQIPQHAAYSSLRERTKDILSVVGALLFGVSCGALTSATMYLAWYLITNRYDFHESDGEDDVDDDEDDDVAAQKKMGYVKIPADAATTKQGYEGN